MKLLVLGPTGTVGSALVAQLAPTGVPMRLFARDPAKLKLRGAGIEVVTGDLDRPDTVDAALAGIDRVFLVTPGPDIPAQDALVIDAAKRAGVKHVVMLSSLGAELGGIAGGGPHLPGEAQLRASGLDWTLLHPSEFMTNARWWKPSIQQAGSLFVPSGDGRVGYVDPRDIAAVAAVALTTDGHTGKTYRLTGPAALSIAEVAAILAETMGRAVRHVDVPDAAFRHGAQQAGMPAPVIEMMSVYYAAVKEGRVDIVTGDVAELTGRPARSFRDWCRDHAAELR